MVLATATAEVTFTADGFSKSSMGRLQDPKTVPPGMLGS
jgi:hypothetical protein